MSNEMKRASTLILIGLCFTLFIILFSCPQVRAAEKTLTFAWEQTLSPDFAGWHLYVKTGSSGNGDLTQYQLALTIPYTGTPQTEYTEDHILTAPDGADTTYFFVLTAFDSDGNESGSSNEVNVPVDLLAPGVPTKVKVILHP